MAASFFMRARAKAQMDATFALYGDSVCQGDYYRSGGTLFKAGVTFLVYPLRPAECDGTVLKAGDQKALVRESDLGQAFQPAAGDYLQAGCGNAKYDVIAGVLDVTASVWTLFCRRRYV